MSVFMKKPMIGAPIIAVCAALFLGVGCPPYRDRDRDFPQVESGVPPKDATSIPPNHRIIMISFKRPVESSTMTKNTFKVQSLADSTYLDGMVALDPTKRMATFTASHDLAENTTYEVTITGVKGISGKERTPIKWKFTTGRVTDKTPPKISMKNPAGEKIPLNSRLEVVFDKNIDPHTVHGFLLQDADGNKVSGEALLQLSDTRRLVFKPDHDLTKDKKYKAIISRDLTDLAGNSLKDEAKWEFTASDSHSGEPSVMPQPKQGDKDVKLDAEIIITFNTSMELNETKLSVMQGANPVAGTQRLDDAGMVLTFTPTNHFERGKVYDIAIDGKDLANNALTTPKMKSWTFHTLDKFTLVSTDPTQSEQMKSDSKITLEFSSPMKVDAMDKDNFLMKEGDPNPIKGKFEHGTNNKFLVFTPGTALEKGRKYTFKIPETVKDEAGDKLQDKVEPIEFSIPPAIAVKVRPEGTKVNRSYPQITVTFNNSMKDDVKDQLKLQDSTNHDVTSAVSSSANRKIFSILPEKHLGKNATYHVVVPAAVKDEWEQELGKVEDWTFTTQDKDLPKVAEHDPADGATVLINKVIVIKFDKPMTRDVLGAFSLRLQDGGAFETKRELVNDDKELRLTPTKLLYDKTYEALLSKNFALDRDDGETLENDLKWSFHTAPELKILKTVPSTGNIAVKFSNKINPHSIANKVTLKHEGSDVAISGLALDHNDKTVLDITPATSLTTGKTYSVTIHKDIEDEFTQKLNKDEEIEVTGP